MSRLGIRHRLLLVVVAAVAAALAVMIVGFNLLLARNLSRDADSLARSRATAALADVRVVNGQLKIGETPDDAAPDTQVWVFSHSKAVEFPPGAGERVTVAASRLAQRGHGFVDVPKAQTRLYATPVVENGQRFGTVVAAVSLRPYHQTQDIALVGSLVFGLAVLLLVALAAHWLLASSLRPVARMTKQASEWSERDLDRRFALGEPTDELTELAWTLDGLFDRLAASLRREQRFSAELSHELRTPLARVLAESELALRRDRTPAEYRELLEMVHRNAEQLTRTIDALVAAAGYEPGAARGTSDAYEVATAAAELCDGASIEIDRPARPIRLGVDAEIAERILQPVIENACRYGRSTVKLAIRRDPEGVRYAIVDDGPGVPEEERERIFEPGVRGSGVNGDGGAGLGLALARRLARSADGDVVAENGTGGGRFVVRLPAG
jgi:two-component system, OmpR family, sensor kinase